MSPLLQTRIPAYCDDKLNDTFRQQEYAMRELQKNKYLNDFSTTSNKYASIQVEEPQHSTSEAEGVSTTPSDEASIKEEFLTRRSFQKSTVPSDDYENPTAAPTHTRTFHNVQEMTKNIQPSEDVHPQHLDVGTIPQSSSQEEEVIYSTNVE
ncbi:hypothetical protein O181_018548 [Austropuccinia psidii MF-1]|uniref:Uncharacterized protein n=1 Tax=Austropuccinia psidii MF-1 TaxID=1389203 RepID=A0A9Q3C830_9BASI|nr:hypothetical protein [Austropuccinia psidii MF-1]